MAMFSRPLTSYFPSATLQWIGTPLDEPPATTFLKEVAHICDAVTHCSRHFARKKDKSFTKDSFDSFQRLSMSSFALLLSHLETFQKAQYATIINCVDFLSGPDDQELAKRLEKCGCVLSLERILAGRGDPREPGEIVADSMKGWHSPEKVNAYFRVVFPQVQVFSNDAVTELELMWQLRHSIVHTAGIITREDSIKAPALAGLCERRLVFSEGFIPAVGRRLHIMVEAALAQLGAAFRKELRPTEEPEGLIESAVGLDSPRRSWFRRGRVATSEI